MRVAVSPLLIVTGLLLAGCSEPRQAENESAAAAPVTDLETLPPDESIATPSEDLADGVIERPLLNRPVETAERLPPALYGRWGLTPADCRADEPSRGLVTISANGVRFFNSFARPAKPIEYAPTGARGEFAFTSVRGLTWTGPLSLTVEDNKLTRVDSETDSRQVYTRCL